MLTALCLLLASCGGSSDQEKKEKEEEKKEEKADKEKKEKADREKAEQQRVPQQQAPQQKPVQQQAAPDMKQQAVQDRCNKLREDLKSAKEDLSAAQAGNRQSSVAGFRNNISAIEAQMAQLGC
jgi:hypothetical protein